MFDAIIFDADDTLHLDAIARAMPRAHLEFGLPAAATHSRSSGG